MAPVAQWKPKGTESEKEKATWKGKGEEKGAGNDSGGKGKRKGAGGGKGDNYYRGRDDDWWSQDTPGWSKKGKAQGQGKGARKGGKGTDGDRGGGGDEGGGRSTLNSSAANFEPSGNYGGYGGYGGYNDYWGWQTPTLPLWKEFEDAESTKYFYNSKTGLCQWECPAELDPKQGAGGAGRADAGGAAEPPAAEMVGHHASADRGGGQGRDGDRGGARGGDRRDGGDRRERGGDPDRRGDDFAGKGRDGGGGKGGGRDQRDRRDQMDADGDRRGRRRGKIDDEKKKDAADFGPPGCNLFVFHLPDDWTDDDLHEYFAPHGTVISAKVMKELGTGRSRGFGFVSYEDRVSSATAIKKMQGYKILGKRLKVEYKKGEGDSSGAHDDERDEDGGEDGGAKKTFPDDERLIGYLRAISAKNVVQSLRQETDAPADRVGGDEGDAAAGVGAAKDFAAEEPDDD